MVMSSPPAAFFASWQPRHFLTRIGATREPRRLRGCIGPSAGASSAARSQMITGREYSRASPADASSKFCYQ